MLNRRTLVLSSFKSNVIVTIVAQGVLKTHLACGCHVPARCIKYNVIIMCYTGAVRHFMCSYNYIHAESTTSIIIVLLGS